MDANTVTAVCATVIALAALVVSFLEARVARQHNRLSVRPLLQLTITEAEGGETGIVLANRGLGPAVITKTDVVLDGESIGDWNGEKIDKFRSDLSLDLGGRYFSHKTVIPIGYERYLLSLDSFDPKKHFRFSDLINKRILLEIHYESLYGGEGLKAVIGSS